jgi:hypothetical protein
MRGLTITAEAELVTETCCVCHMLFAMPKDFHAEKRRYRQSPNRNGFYCPAGHVQVYLGESEETKLRRQRDEAQRHVDAEIARRRRAEEREEHARRVANGHKGYAAKLAKRAKAGACPCCNRTFQNLQRHMTTQHPAFAAPSDESVMEPA